MNKKKQITLVLLICLITVVSFTSYAIIQKNIPNNNDLTKLAILVDGVKQKEFPTKDSGKVFEKLECTNSGIASWDSETWKLTINDITGPTECTISFGEPKEYADTSGAEQPELNNGLIPVAWNGSNWIKADISTKWYDYNTQWWANAVTVTSSSRSTYTSATANTPISMNDIETMWVWVPRYEYQHTNLGDQYAGGTQTQPGAITINFINKDTTVPSSSNFTIHDAFWWDNNNNGTKDTGEQLAGIWVAKFEMSPTDATCKSSASTANCNKLQAIHIKPNVTSWRYAQIGTMWTAIYENMNGTNNQYGLTNTDAHLMKNMEWGAAAYLSQSKYGKYGNATYTDGTDKEVSINNCSKYITGIGGDTVSAPSSSTTCTTNTYETTKGQTSSTTGNIYGIYDMSGGTFEYVMGVMKANGSSEPVVGHSASESSGWSGKICNEFNDCSVYTGTYERLGDDPNTSGIIEGIGNKYYDLYEYGGYSEYTRGHSGDATIEMKEWYSDYAGFVYSYNPFFSRGGIYSYGTQAGVFEFDVGHGGAYSNLGGRPTLVPLN